MGAGYLNCVMVFVCHIADSLECWMGVGYLNCVMVIVCHIADSLGCWMDVGYLNCHCMCHIANSRSVGWVWTF